MKISEWKLTLTYEGDEHTSTKELVYHGNENIILRECIDDQMELEVRLERSILEHFLEIIKYG